ncbi:hypothetical protein PR202_gb27600 [Eleusine coracana subsp. coracana]|uniref:Uncharacterized protein n=1 Tax=Eleusine coracana subsp. coracana TaxID=191504 RepID=A0AAV5FUB2_ELECO|nr:hypothetical protein QOZ80_6AG0541890 [Eleusine coracana subsp. coracana]GJN38546.1 hypothetical protein PR202_gb27600 [Eleusine coracana subsp. coracana]
MYMTRPMSRYLADPKAAAEEPPEGPGSGFLVVVDEATKELASRCCGLSWDRRLKGLPFPQSRQVALQHSNSMNPAFTGIECCLEILGSKLCFDIPSGRPPGSHTPAPIDLVVFVPVVGLPLSSGRYYVVRAEGKHKGMVSACSKEEDKTSCCCFCTCVKDVKPRPFDSGDVYQQMEVAQSGSRSFKAESVMADGIPPEYLRKKGWKVSIASPKYDLADDAQGVNRERRHQMPPDLDAPPVVVGKWYVPFLFVKADGKRRLKDQAKETTFYEMTLEQSWDQIYTATAGEGNQQEVAVTATVRRRTALLGGTDAVKEGSPYIDGGTIWFRPAADGGVGLDKVVWEKMRWEMEKEGWWVAAGNGHDGEERIERVERRDSGLLGSWNKFACYVLVERFVLRRMDRSVALTCDFKHTDKIRVKWA